VFGVDEDFAFPEAFGDFRAGNELTVGLDQEDEELHRLALEGDPSAVAAQFEAAAVERELAELKDGGDHGASSWGSSIPGISEESSNLSMFQGFGASPELYLRLHLLFLASAAGIAFSS
jgi:hypothetical protein